MAVKNSILFLIGFLLIVSIVNFSVIYLKMSNIDKKYTGYASSFVNITVSQYIVIELVNDEIDWGAGSLNGTGLDSFNATLYTNGYDNGTVLRGNWSGENVTGFLLENLGNVNCSLYIKTSKNAHDFFNSEAGNNEEFKIKVQDALTQSCNGNTGSWIDSNISGSGTLYCNQFGYFPQHNQIYIDVLLTVPGDGLNNGEQSEIITIFGNAVG